MVYNDNGSVTILPNKYMDGFFIAKLKKKKVNSKEDKHGR